MTYALSREHTLSGDLLARLWAQQRAWVLAAFPRQNEQALVALGKAALSSPLANVPYYHIGGKERWHDLVSSAGASLELA